MNTACSHCSHWFPTFLCRLRESIKGRAIDLFSRAHWFYSGFTLLAEIGEPFRGCGLRG